MKLVYFTSKKTYKGKEDGKEYHYKNLYLVLDNGMRVLIKPVNREDYSTLKAVAEYGSYKQQ